MGRSRQERREKKRNRKKQRETEGNGENFNRNREIRENRDVNGGVKLVKKKVERSGETKTLRDR
eukprot:889707-Amorphochlora_amoeboformis.AAC.1